MFWPNISSWNAKTNIPFDKILFFFFLCFCLLNEQRNHTYCTNAHIWMGVCTVVLWSGRCSIIQSISLGFGSDITCIWNLTLPYPETPPPTAEKLPELPWGRQRGNVNWLRGTNPPQQQLFPNLNNLGTCCVLYFMGGEGLRMFIYLSPQSALICVCACMCLWKKDVL